MLRKAKLKRNRKLAAAEDPRATFAEKTSQIKILIRGVQFVTTARRGRSWGDKLQNKNSVQFSGRVPCGAIGPGVEKYVNNKFRLINYRRWKTPCRGGTKR